MFSSGGFDGVFFSFVLAEYMHEASAFIFWSHLAKQQQNLLRICVGAGRPRLTFSFIRRNASEVLLLHASLLQTCLSLPACRAAKQLVHTALSIGSEGSYLTRRSQGMAILRAARYLHMVMLLVPVAKVPAWSFHSSVLSTWGSEMPPVVSIMAIFFLAASAISPAVNLDLPLDASILRMPGDIVR